MPTSKTILWAIDPFETGPRAASAALQEFARWAACQEMAIVPTYIASLTAAERVRGKSVPLEELERAINEVVEELGVSGARPARVLVEETATRAGAVEQLLRAADEERAQGIALCSHGRAGIGRFVLGSFAETLLRDSRLPIYFLARKPDSLPAQPVDSCTVLFATDFSSTSRAAFRRLLADTRLSTDRLILFHALGFPMRYAGGEMVFVPENYFEEEERSAHERGAEWVAEAHARGIAAELTISAEGTDILIGDAILRAARENEAALVVMAASSSFLDRALFGSVAYEVFRASTCSALIYGPRALISDQELAAAESLARATALRA